jgi:hypothetical protein
MSTWIDVNGAKIEKVFLDENIREAKTYSWKAIDASEIKDHAHCMVCWVTIDTKTQLSPAGFKSNCGYVCTYCHEHFLK